jgi:AraC-like DNA-binding protein
MKVMPAISMGSGTASISRGRALLLMDDRRSFYRGFVGKVHGRNFGGHVVYVALDAPIDIRIGAGEWQRCEMAVIAPHVSHAIKGGASCAAQVILENEDIAPEHLPGWMNHGSGVIRDEALIDQWRSTCASMLPSDAVVPSEWLDHMLFGQSLPRPQTDARIVRVMQDILAKPGEQHSAQLCASTVALSSSRFLHLFSREVGVPFRRFRAWKRARSLLYNLQRECNLTELALACGYADSAHFSNSIREVYGFKPTDLVSAGRHLSLVQHHNSTFAIGGLAMHC